LDERGRFGRHTRLVRRPGQHSGGNTPTDAPGMKLNDTEFERPGAAASESTTVLSESSLYSLSDQGSLVLVSGGTVSGGQSSTLSSIFPAVPEPSTWAMMALGLGSDSQVTGELVCVRLPSDRKQSLELTKGRQKGSPPSFSSQRSCERYSNLRGRSAGHLGEAALGRRPKRRFSG
jgi:hypothetical protein